MTTRVVELNEDVDAVRRLRAAAHLPQFVAVCCVLLPLFFLALGLIGWPRALLLLLGAAGALVVARAIRRGARWAVLVLLGAVSAISVLTLAAFFAGGMTALERTQMVATSAVILAPCWVLAVLGMKGLRHRKAVLAVYAASQSAWARTPRVGRSRPATLAFASALAVYLVGLVPAAIAVGAVGGHLWIFAIVYAPIAAVAARLWNRGLRLTALGLQEIRRLDSRRPTILLRSFGDDNLPLGKRSHFFWFLFAAKETLTLESFVVDQVWRLGPVLAIGKPGEDLRPLGAAREYIPEDGWRLRIREYLHESRYVVAILGGTPGLSWEYEQMQALGKKHDVIVVFPPHSPVELQHRWNIFQTMFGPAQAVTLQWAPFIGCPLLAFFGQDAVTILYCRFRHEIAYAAAFSRLSEAIGTNESI